MPLASSIKMSVYIDENSPTASSRQSSSLYQNQQSLAKKIFTAFLGENMMNGYIAMLCALVLTLSFKSISSLKFPVFPVFSPTEDAIVANSGEVGTGTGTGLEAGASVDVLRNETALTFQV